MAAEVESIEFDFAVLESLTGRLYQALPAAISVVSAKSSSLNRQLCQQQFRGRSMPHKPSPADKARAGMNCQLLLLLLLLDLVLAGPSCVPSDLA